MNIICCSSDLDAVFVASIRVVAQTTGLSATCFAAISAWCILLMVDETR
ncbi:hypothetical protein [Citrobacter sp. JGM124]|nr:hypothetical protein [Citrobacter sp. JGM124]MBS0847194.1 hypothetical protein [Citrobacter sp. JGM124]